MINLVNGLNIFSGLSNETITQPVGVTPTYIELVNCANVTVQNVTFQNYDLGQYGGDAAVVLIEDSPGTLLKNIKISNVNPSPPTLIDEYKYILIKRSRGTVVDCCQLIDKHNGSAALAVNSAANVPDEVTIRRCLFKNIGPLSSAQDGNGYEAIRLSDSARSQESSQSLIENCVFINCGSDGEPENISIKRFDVTVRGCAFYGCPSLITVRHGGRGLIENNYVDGQNVVGSGGIRVFGNDNIIRGNYIANTNGDPRFRQAIVVGNGQVNPALNGYWVANRAIIDSNTLVNNTFGISIGEDGGDSSLTVLPTGVVQTAGTSPYANGTLQPVTEANVCSVTIDAAFVGSPTAGNAPLSVAFANQSTGGATSWLWNFGDGTTSTLQNPTHTYATPGTYSVTLTATGPDGSNTETRTSYISANAATGGCLIEITTAGGIINPSFTPLGGAFEPGSTVTMTDTSTATNGITHRSWRIAPRGSGASAFVEFGTGPTATYTFPATGEYRVILRAAGPDGCYEAFGDFRMSDNALIAAFSGTPQGGFAPHTVNFQDLSTSQDGITSWLWEFGDGTTSTLQNPSHTYTATGTYNVKLTVTGPGGTDSIQNDNYVSVYGITPSFSSNPALSGYTNEPFTFTNTTTATPPITSTRWEYSSNGVNWTTFATGLDVANFAFPNPGTYQVRLTAGNAQGQASTTKQVVVYERVNASFTATPPAGTAPLPVNFRDTSTGSPTAWEWDFGDGATSTAQNPTYTYTAPGTYLVKLKTTGPGGTSTQTQTIYVVESVEPACTGNLVCIDDEGRIFAAPVGVPGQVLMMVPDGIIWTNL